MMSLGIEMLNIKEYKAKKLKEDPVKLNLNGKY